MFDHNLLFHTLENHFFSATSNIPTTPTVVLTINLPVLIPAFLNSPCKILLGIVISVDRLSKALPVPASNWRGNFL